jgi:hypothetical protein
MAMPRPSSAEVMSTACSLAHAPTAGTGYTVLIEGELHGKTFVTRLRALHMP